MHRGRSAASRRRGLSNRYDGEIVKSVDLSRIQPFLLVWEFIHLVDKHKRGAEAWNVVNEVEDYVKGFGYDCWRVIPENMFCTKPKTTKLSAERLAACADGTDVHIDDETDLGGFKWN